MPMSSDDAVTEAAETARLQRELEALEAQLRDQEPELRTANEKKERALALIAEAQALRARAEEARKYCAVAAAELADFPSDTAVLKLERRVESLKNTTRDAERLVESKKTGIEAYGVRRSGCGRDRRRLVADLSSHTAAALEKMRPFVAEDAGVRPASVVSAGVAALCDICEQCEKEVLAGHRQLADLAAEERQRTKRIQELQAARLETAPRLDAEKRAAVAAISAAWAGEEAALQATYDRLFAVNKEQQFHLQRGTHIKRAAAALVDSTEVMSDRHTRVASDINEARSRLEQHAGDVAHLQRQADQLRAAGRAVRAGFEKQREAALARLEAAARARREAEAEGQSLRDVKAELYEALQSAREHQPALATPRLSLL